MTLIDVIVGTAIMLVIFLAIFGAFRISVELVYSTKAKTGAVSIMTEHLEYIRGLPYASVGTVGGIPAGGIPQSEEESLNGVTYTVHTLIQYTDAPEDGLDTNDENGITADYKTVKVEVVWSVKGSLRSTFAVTDIAPKGEESLNGGGTLHINVFDQAASPVVGATVRIVNSGTDPTIDVSAETNTSGIVSFPGAPEATGYEIYVSKSGYSSAQTYGVTSENPNPSPIHVSVVEAQTTTASFAIDRDASLHFTTYAPAGPGSFFDTFTGSSGLSSLNQTAVVGGALVLDEDPDTGYPASGNAFSDPVSPSYLVNWDEITFSTSTPAGTALVVRLYYDDNGTYTLVPDTDLPGNSAGLTESPIDISSLDTGDYTTLQLGAFLTSEDTAVTPRLLDWELSYVAGPTPLPGVALDIHGAKTIGTNAEGEPVYKYDALFTTNSTAEWTIDPAEWDDYTISLNDTTAYNVVERCPNVVAPDPGQDLDVSIIVGDNTAHALRASVTDESDNPVAGASVTLSGPESASGTTDACGQAYFGGIATGVYSVTITKSGFETHQENVGVNGETEYSLSLYAN